MAYSSKNLNYLLTALQLCLASCSTRRDASWDPILQGSIDYPFGDATKPLGVNGPEDKFVLKSQVGKTEYTIEIPKLAVTTTSKSLSKNLNPKEGG